jgi:D-amino peptidase
VPVAVITGDDATCREGRDLVGEKLTAVVVKRGLSRYSARNIPPVRARQMIQDGVASALKARNWPNPYVPQKPTTITIHLGTVDSANQFKDRHNVEFPDPLKVVSRGPDWLTAWNQVWHW